MSTVLDIARTYIAPREVLAGRMAGDVREDRALVTLLLGCGLLFIAQWPLMSREAYLDPSMSFDQRLAGAFFGWLMFMPLAFYVLAIVLTVLARLVDRNASGYRIRVGLFWSLLASAPLWLLAGLMLGFQGRGAASNITGSVALMAFGIFSVIGIVVAMRRSKELET